MQVIRVANANQMLNKITSTLSMKSTINNTAHYMALMQCTELLNIIKSYVNELLNKIKP